MIKFSSEFFNIEDTLFCGQIFRFKPYLNGYLVFSQDKVCYVHSDCDSIIIESEDDEYFYNYFDLARDYGAICDRVKSFDNSILNMACESGKGIRILQQDPEEMIFSFIVSQNNNIPRIKGIIEKLSKELGRKINSSFGEYYAFPKASALATMSEDFFKQIGLGYRASYFVDTSKNLADGEFLKASKLLKTKDLREKLISLKGVGPKVADCILLFGYNRKDSFPVDTWVEKIYHEDLCGDITDRKKISDYLVNKFGDVSGYVQQYLFYYKRGK